MTDRSFVLARAVGIWLTLVAVESIHGVLRRLFLEPRLGDLRARQVSVFTGAVLIALVFWLTLGWLRPQPAKRWWAFGLLWLALTLAFEIGVGRATGMSWDRIASDFDPRSGGLLALGMLVILVAPRLLAQRRGLLRDLSKYQPMCIGTHCYAVPRLIGFFSALSRVDDHESNHGAGDQPLQPTTDKPAPCHRRRNRHVNEGAQPDRDTRGQANKCP